MAEQKSLKKNIALNFIKTFMSLVFPLITFPYASRVLQPEGLGKVNFAQSIVSYFAMIAALGIGTYGIREAAKRRDDKGLLSQFVKEVFTINMIATAVAYILFGVSLLCIPKFYPYRSLLCICSASILFTTLGMDWLYSALEEYEYITIRSIAFQIVSLVLLFVFVRTKDDYLQYAGISVISNVGSNLCNFVHSRHFITFTTQQKLELKKHLKPIFTLFVMALTISIYTALDTTMLGLMKGDRSVGIYTAATKINKIVLSVVTAMSAVLLPRLSYYASDKTKKDEFKELVYKAFDFLLLVSIPAAIGLCLVSRPAVMILSGEEYIDAINVMRIMNPIIVIIAMSNLIGIQIFMPLNHEKWTLYSVMAGAVSNFTMNYFLIPRFDAAGAAIASVIAESVVTIIQLFMVRHIIELNRPAKSFVKYLLSSLAFVPFVLLSIYVIKNIVAQFIVSVLIGGIIYITVLILEKNKFVFTVLRMIKRKVYGKV